VAQSHPLAKIPGSLMTKSGHVSSNIFLHTNRFATRSSSWSVTMEPYDDKSVCIYAWKISDHKNLTIKVRTETTKNGRERFVALSPITYQKLQQYLMRERARLS